MLAHRFELLLLYVAVGIDCLVFLVALLQHAEPRVAAHSRQVRCSAVIRRQMLRRDVFVQLFLIVSEEEDPVAEFLAQKRLEQRENDVENFRLVDDVDSLDAHRHRVLQPVDDSLGELRRELPRLLEREPVHVENDDGTVHLSLRLKHRRLQEHNAAFEDLVQGHFLVLPSLCEPKRVNIRLDFLIVLQETLTSKLQQQYAATELISVREHHQNVLLEDVRFVRRRQVRVDVRMLHFELVVPLDLFVRRKRKDNRLFSRKFERFKKPRTKSLALCG